MCKITRKLIAVLLAIWLPLFGGSALAATVSMQLQQDACAGMDMQMPDDHQRATPDQMPDQQHAPCDNCGICHLVSSGYLAGPDTGILAVQQTSASVTPYLFSYHSITSTPLLPPPLA